VFDYLSTFLLIKLLISVNTDKMYDVPVCVVLFTAFYMYSILLLCDILLLWTCQGSVMSQFKGSNTPYVRSLVVGWEHWMILLVVYWDMYWLFDLLFSQK